MGLRLSCSAGLRLEPLLLVGLMLVAFRWSAVQLPAPVDAQPAPANSSAAPVAATNQSLATAEQQYKLPSWFSFDLYKRFHGKRYARGPDNELHKRIYLQTALIVFERRALYRAGRASSLPSLNELSDLVS